MGKGSGAPTRRRASNASVDWPLTDFIAIDFETANYQADSACAVGLVKVVANRVVEAVVQLIRPPTREFRFTDIHGLAWADVAEVDDFGALWPKLAGFLDGATFFAAHNASFDRRVLEACCATYGLAAPGLPFRCTVQLARAAWSIYPTRLPDVCSALGIALDHHEALSDARACAAIVLAAATRRNAEQNPKGPVAREEAMSFESR
jgi:DNA polymerase-3 subunit epsilon